MNIYQSIRQLDLYGYSAVYSCYKRMKPRVILFKKRQQGSSDPKSGWAIATVMIFLQVLLRQGEITMNDPLLNQFRDINGELPAYFQKENLQSIDRNRMGYWDEAHRKCRVGASGSRDNKNEYIIFTHTENNKFSMTGSFDDSKESRKFVLNVKYAAEVRISAGVGLWKVPDSDIIEGVKMPLFYYSGR